MRRGYLPSELGFILLPALPGTFMIPSAASQYNAAVSMEVGISHLHAFMCSLMQHKIPAPPQVHVMPRVCGNECASRAAVSTQLY